MSAATISTKGQLVIPQRFREALHLRAGDKLLFSLEGDKLIIQRSQPHTAALRKGVAPSLPVLDFRLKRPFCNRITATTERCPPTVGWGVSRR